MATSVASSRSAAALLVGLLLAGCGPGAGEARELEGTIARYHELVRDGYQRQNMSWMREVASEEQAQRLYNHMAALGAAGVRMSSTVDEARLVRIDLRGPGEALVETREVWSFVHHRIATGEKLGEEKGFVYRVGYTLRRERGRWLVTRADVIAGDSTNTVVPWAAPGEPRSGVPGDGRPPAGPR